MIDGCPRIRKAVDLEKAEIAAALRENAGEIADAAVQLRVSPQGLKRRASALGLTT